MKPLATFLFFFLSFFGLQAQTFVDAFLKNKDSITVYHDWKGQEMTPTVRFYLFADSIVPDTSGRIDAGRLLSKWNRYVLGKTASRCYLYRQRERYPIDYSYWHSLTIEGEDKDGNKFELWRYPLSTEDVLEPDLIVKPSIVYYAPENDSFDTTYERNGCYSAWYRDVNHHLESEYHRSMNERRVVCVDLLEAKHHGWFLKGDILYTGYVVDTISHRTRLRTVQEALDDIDSETSHYINRIDSTCLIPIEKRQKIARILDDELTSHIYGSEDWISDGIHKHGKDKEKIPDSVKKYTIIPCKEAYRNRGKENQYFGPIEYRRFLNKEDCAHWKALINIMH